MLPFPSHRTIFQKSTHAPQIYLLKKRGKKRNQNSKSRATNESVRHFSLSLTVALLTSKQSTSVTMSKFTTNCVCQATSRMTERQNEEIQDCHGRGIRQRDSPRPPIGRGHGHPLQNLQPADRRPGNNLILTAKRQSRDRHHANGGEDIPPILNKHRPSPSTSRQALLKLIQEHREKTKDETLQASPIPSANIKQRRSSSPRTSRHALLKLIQEHQEKTREQTLQAFPVPSAQQAKQRQSLTPINSPPSLGRRNHSIAAAIFFKILLTITVIATLIYYYIYYSV